MAKGLKMIDKQKVRLTHEVAQKFIKIVQGINYEERLHDELFKNINLTEDEIQSIVKNRLDSIEFDLVYSLEPCSDYLNKEISME